MDQMCQMIDTPSGWLMFGVVGLKVNSLIVRLILSELMTVATTNMLELSVLEVLISYTELNS